MDKFVIPGELMDLNSFINQQRINRYVGAKVKKKQTNLCALHIKSFMNQGLKVDRYPVYLRITWYVKNRRKDKDNIAFAKKFILDGMQQAGLIKDDGWDQISGFYDDFKVDKKQPRVEVQLDYVDNRSEIYCEHSGDG